MKQEFRSFLVPETISLLEEIENSLGEEVQVIIDQNRQDTLACDIDGFTATILTPNENHFPDGSVFHELLHLKRFCVEEIPRMVICENHDCGPRFAKGIVDLDNNLEHFVIVPKDIEHNSKRKTYWEIKLLDKIRGPRFQGLDALIYWAFSKHIFPESSVFKKADCAIIALKLRENAEKIHQDILKNLESKESLVKALLIESDAPRSAICLEYSNFKAQQRTERSLEYI